MLVYFLYLDKNPGWIRDNMGNDFCNYILEDFWTCGYHYDRLYVGLKPISFDALSIMLHDSPLVN